MHDYAYHKKINRKVYLQSRLISLHFLFRLRYEILKCWKHIDNDFKKINRRVSLQIRSHKIKNNLITLNLLFRLRYEILKRWNVNLSKCYLNKHSNRYSTLNYQIRLFSMILINSNSRIENYEFKINFFLIKIIILLTLNLAKSFDIVKTTYNLNSKTQIRNLQLLLYVNINNQRDLMQSIKINIRCDKISNMMFLNDLNWFQTRLWKDLDKTSRRQLLTTMTRGSRLKTSIRSLLLTS